MWHRFVCVLICCCFRIRRGGRRHDCHWGYWRRQGVRSRAGGRRGRGGEGLVVAWFVCSVLNTFIFHRVTRSPARETRVMTTIAAAVEIATPAQMVSLSLIFL